MLRGSTLQLFIDRQVAPEDTEALQKLSKGSKAAAVEDGFVGSALHGGGVSSAASAGGALGDPMLVDR